MGHSGQPTRRFKIGGSVQYFLVDDLADALGTEPRHVRGLCSALKVPVIHFPGHPKDEGYVLLYALEMALFELGMPEKIKTEAGLLRVHQELAGIMYGTLTKEALVKRVKMIAKELTSAGQAPKIKKQREPRWGVDAYKRFSGVDPR